MNYFGLTPEEIETRGGQWTAREIVQQPEIWQEVEQLIRSDTGGVAAPRRSELVDLLLVDRIARMGLGLD